MATELLMGMLAKLPVLPPPTVTLLNEITVVAVASEEVSNVPVPLIFSRPVIGAACALAKPKRDAAVIARNAFNDVIFFR